MNSAILRSLFCRRRSTVRPARVVAGLLAVFLGSVVARAESIYRTPYTFTTLAGLASYSSNNGTGMNARFSGPSGVAMDAAGNVYVVDQSNDMVRKITPAGVVSTVAGLAGISGSVDGPGTDARFNNPTGIAIDAAGNLYVTDTGNHTVRKISATGTVTTLAGGAGLAGNVDAAGSAARFNKPTDLAIDPSGNLYLYDSEIRAIRRVTPAGVVTTFIGSPAVDERWSAAVGGYRYYYDEYTGLQFQIHGLAVDAGGNVLVSEGGTIISGPYGSPSSYAALRKISPAGVISTLPSAAAPYGNFSPFGKLTVTTGGELLVATSYTLYRIAADGTATLLAGNADASGNHGEFFADGPGDKARLMWPRGITTDAAGNIFFTDYSNIVRKFSAAGEMSTLAGMPKFVAEQNLDGTGGAARFSSISGIALQRNGTLFATDFDGTIRKITPAGAVTTVAVLGTPDGFGGLARALMDVAIDSAGNLYTADLVNDTIIKVTPDGTASVFAGTAGVQGYVDGPAADARFSGPDGVAIDAADNIYVTDLGNCLIRKITPAGVVSTVAGKLHTSGYVDGPAAEAQFGNPEGVAVDGAGNLYVADSINHAIRKITPGGVVSTLAGTGSAAGAADDTGTAATFDRPTGVTVDSQGNVFVVDSFRAVVRRITPTGEVTTIAGMPEVWGAVDGTGRNARFLASNGIAVDASGAVYVANGNTISKGLPATGPVIVAQPQSQTVASGASVTLSVMANAAPAPTYQWQFNGSAISGATGTEYNIAIARSADAGEYSVIVTNDVGSVTSNKAVLSVGGSGPSNPPGGGGAGGGGGGAPSTWFLAALAALGVARWLRRAGFAASGEQL